MKFSLTLAALALTAGIQPTQAAQCAREITSATKVTDLLLCIVKMNAEIESLSATSAVPGSAVLAFDNPKGCPSGWSPFSRADGRVIVGVTTDENGLSTRFYGEEGGVETVKLTVNEMPSHNHISIDAVALTWAQWGHGDQGDIRGGEPPKGSDKFPGAFTSETGRGEPHNNMPPYIALYYCEKN